MAAVALAAASPSTRKLRVGLFADAPLQPRWLVEAFDRVARSDFAEIVLISVGSRRSSTPLLWRAFAGTCEQLDLSAIRPPVSDGQSLPGLDVAFALGDLDDRPLDGVARFGVWRFCFGNERGHAETLAGWREFADGAPVTGAAIKVRLSAGAPARVACQSWSRTDTVSLARTRARLLGKCAELAFRALREVQRDGTAYLDQCRIVRDADVTARAVAGAEVLKALPAIGARLVETGLQKALNYEQSFLAWRWREERFGDSRAIAPDLRGFSRGLAPAGRTWSQPFAIAKHGRYFVFFTERVSGKSHISMLEIKRDGRWIAPVRVLERGYSLSHPHLVEEGGELYLLADRAPGGPVEVYRCVDFPQRWKLEQPLLEAPLTDATLHRAADRWWLFGANADDELLLYHTQDLLGPWRAHPRNPVVGDVRCARPAGQLYMRAGALYRPAQICAPAHGTGLAMNRVLRLTPDEYVERQVERILPAPGLCGMRTLNRAGELTVIDAGARRSRFA